MLWSLFFTFFKIGLFTFGGGYAMIAGIKEVVVDKKQWLCDDELMQVITVAESTPGPIAINLATYVGYKKKGFLGSLFATLGVILPSLVILFAISLFFDAFLANKYVAFAFKGIKCAVAFIIIKAGVDIFKKLPKKALPHATFGTVFALLLVLEVLSVNFSSVVLIILGGILGLIVYSNCGKQVDK